jgi:DNA replication protein DnaC
MGEIDGDRPNGAEFTRVGDILAGMQPGAEIPVGPAVDRPRVCPACRGTGWLYPVIDGKPAYDRVISCECQAAAVRQQRFRASRLSEWQEYRLYNFNVRPGTDFAYQRALEMAKGKPRHHFLTLAGETGTGKTHLTKAIGVEWIERLAGTVLYVKVADVLDELRRGYDDKGSQPDEMSGFDRLMEWLKRVGLLIMDDLGVEKTTEWSSDKLDSIIDFRYEKGLATVLTTNLAPSQLGSRIESRLMGGVVVRIKAPDYRQIQAKQRKAGVK